MKNIATFDTDDLVLVGRKREWVPMWLWTNVIFRYKLWLVWPISYLTYQSRQIPIARPSEPSSELFQAQSELTFIENRFKANAPITTTDLICMFTAMLEWMKAAEKRSQ
jgi:hypothetical protein